MIERKQKKPPKPSASSRQAAHPADLALESIFQDENKKISEAFEKQKLAILRRIEKNLRKRNDAAQ